MPDPVPVVDVKTLVDKLGEVYSSLAAAQAKLATREAELESEKAAKAAERDRDRYAHLREDFAWRTLRMVLVFILVVVFVESNEKFLRDLFRPRPPVDFAEHVSALVDVKDTATRNDRVRRIRDCMKVLDTLFPATTRDTSPAQKQDKERGDDGKDTRITDADKAELNVKCSILTTR